MKNKVIVPIMSLFLIGCTDGENESQSGTSTIAESTSEMARVCGNGVIEEYEECEILEDNCNNCILDRRIFVTNDEFGGLSTYKVIVDDYCDILAKKAGLVGKFNWKPWLSTYGLSVLNRINIHSSSNYVLIDYKTIVASNFYDLIDGVLENPINMNEFGDLLDGADVWTGTDELGGTLKNCDHWQGGSEYEGVYGNTSFLDFRWTNLRIDGCGSEHHIYCIEDDLRD